MNREATPASLETTHSYTAVSSTVGAITTSEPDVNNLKKKKIQVPGKRTCHQGQDIEISTYRNNACICEGFDSNKLLRSHL